MLKFAEFTVCWGSSSWFGGSETSPRNGIQSITIRWIHERVWYTVMLYICVILKYNAALGKLYYTKHQAIKWSFILYLIIQDTRSKVSYTGIPIIFWYTLLFFIWKYLSNCLVLLPIEIFIREIRYIWKLITLSIVFI